MLPPLTRTLFAALAALLLSLALARLHPFGDANLFAASRSQPPQLPASIPPAARGILANSCADCHSSTARAPIYGHFAPISWLLERDIVVARNHLNLSNWDNYSADQQQVLLAEIAQQARTGLMPPPQYTLIHRNARLTAADIAALTAWTHAASLAIDSAAGSSSGLQPAVNSPQKAGGFSPGSRASTSANLAPRTPPEPRTANPEPASPAAPDPTRGAAHPTGTAAQGEDVFNRRCTGCHSLTQNGEGPRLAGIYGRAAASVPGFQYSAALTAAHLTWNDQTLDQWLADPDAFVPNNNMDFRVPRPQERADLIAFLKASSK